MSTSRCLTKIVGPEAPCKHLANGGKGQIVTLCCRHIVDVDPRIMRLPPRGGATIFFIFTVFSSLKPLKLDTTGDVTAVAPLVDLIYWSKA